MRVRGNAHQVFDKYQALAREAATSGDRIQAEAYWQYADHYYRLIQSMGGFVQRNNQGWGEGGEEGQQAPPQQGQQMPPAMNGNGNGYAHVDRPGDDSRPDDHQAVAESGPEEEAEPGLGGVAFLQNGRNSPSETDPAVDEQPEVPEFNPPGGRRS